MDISEMMGLATSRLRATGARGLAIVTALTAVTATTSPVRAQEPRVKLRVEHTVEVRDPATKQFHVTSRFIGMGKSTLELALPAWTPGFYTMKNYAANVSRMTFTDGSGRNLRHSMVTAQRWRVEGAAEIVVSFDYLADELGTNAAKINDHFAIFTGTQLFLEPIGHRNAPASVRFSVPSGWGVASALEATSDPTRFIASSYDELVDSPAVLGAFDSHDFTIQGKPHHIVAVPAGVMSAPQLDTIASLASDVARVEQGTFGGGLPYRSYTYFFVFQHADSGAGGGLEHASSFVDVTAAWPSKIPVANLIGAIAHEYFHLWNVKRMRPAGMWPYDYSRENYTPLLWVSEGFTNYFANLARLRTGRWRSEDAIAAIARSIQYIDTAAAARYVSPADASISTWQNGFTVNYYGSGQTLGAFLDLSILHDTNGRARIDDVMRALWNDTYLKGRGFTEVDIERAVKKISGRDYSQFFASYANGVEPIPYDSFLAFAGFRLDKSSQIAGKNVYTLVDMPHVTEAQLRLRRLWLEMDESAK